MTTQFPGRRRASALALLGLTALLCASAPAAAATPSEPGAKRAPSLRADQPPGAGAEGAGRGLALLARKAVITGEDGRGSVDHPVLLVKDGRIEALGRQGELEVPEGYEVQDYGDKWLTPGLVDLHCHVAGPSLMVNDLNDMVFLTNPGLRVSPAVIPGMWTLDYGVAGGVTTVLYIPGSGTNMGGFGVVLKTGFDEYEAMEVRNPGSLKLAQAGNPERWLIGPRRSFMNWNSRNTFKRGLAYAKRWQDYEATGGPKPPKDPMWEGFHGLLTGDVPVSTHTQIYQVVMMTILMPALELGLNTFIDHGSFDGYKAAALAEEAGVPAILGPRQIVYSINRPPFFVMDTDGAVLGMAAEYQKAGHTMVGFNTDAPVIPQETLQLQAAMGVRYGFDHSDGAALRGLTIVPAKTIGLADRIGSLAPGKDADVLVTTGDPVDPRHSIEVVFIEGRRVYDAEEGGRRW